MKRRKFIQCDVFSPIPTKGNALAVVLDGSGLTDEQMRTFAAWTNLAETTFIFPPSIDEADYKLRIFTPTREMLFAGHPTLGSCSAWLHTGGVPKHDGVVRQECGVGIVEIDLTGNVPAFIAPPTRIKALPESDKNSIAHALGIDPNSIEDSAVLENGPTWHVLALSSAKDVLSADASGVRWPDFTPVGLIGPHPQDAECQYEVRMLAPSSGMTEDPITGSLNSAIFHWLQAEGKLHSDTLVAQGTMINRTGRVFIRPHRKRLGEILVGGHTHIIVEGHVYL
ncbi:MAG: PhzF family phenazine biosynthesis isomerase [Gammaproteobacteria bacterium]|nr:PhzF family phenazine biosynthesis isomerase [Gammaproteobacteria bacterium]